MSFFVLLVCLLVLNLWWTRRILRLGERMAHRRLQLAMLWILPFAGAFYAWLEVLRCDREDQLIARGASAPESVEAPPEQLSAPGVDGLPLGMHIESANGFPLFDWRAIDAWLATIDDADARSAARTQSRRAWVEHLRAALGGHFRVHETDDAFVLSSLEPAVVRATAAYVTTTRRRIAKALGALAAQGRQDKSVLLVLDHEDDYYRYVGIYYPDDGEFAFSGGMFIDAGCPHFIVKRADLTAIEPVIAHELTHATVSYLRLPKWLDEGIAVNMEHRLAGAGHALHTPQEMRAKHLRYWGPPEIQQFWSGESFLRTDDGNLLSYDLARIIVEQLAKTWEPFAQFVQQAAPADAGAASAATHLGIDLGAYVCVLFDRKPSRDWSPQAA